MARRMAKRQRRRARSIFSARDLISRLDDDVLVHILRLLPETNHAARTAAISRRWRDLWARVPELRIVSICRRHYREVAAAFDRRAPIHITQPTAAIDGVDVISGLNDDVLLRVLDLLPDACDAVRTGALSRRWRGLWKGVTTLRFSSSIRPEFIISPERFVAFVDDTLALLDLAAAKQADHPAVDHLAISLSLDRLPRNSVEAVPGWIRHAVKSFVLEQRMPFDNHYDSRPDSQQFVVTLDGLPSPSKLETLRLSSSSLFHKTALRLDLGTAAAMFFPSLMDLSLDGIHLPPGSHSLLGRLLSTPFCPGLRKLQLRRLRLADLNELRLEATQLLELSWELMQGSQILELQTPSLRVLHMADRIGEPQTFIRISAPRLQELTILGEEPMHIEVNGELQCLEILKVAMQSHMEDFGDDDSDVEVDMNYFSFGLLRRFTSAKCLEVLLHVSEREYQAFDIINERIPRLPHVISLTIDVKLYELHSNRAGVVDILTQCNNLKYLHIRCSIHNRGELKPHHFLCYHHDYWKSHDISLVHLLEVEFTGLEGTECELWFMQIVLRNATQLQKATISFDPKYRLLKDRRNAFGDLIPVLLCGGTWTTICSDACLSYEWKR